MAKAGEAQARMETSPHIGKIVLTVPLASSFAVLLAVRRPFCRGSILALRTVRSSPASALRHRQGRDRDGLRKLRAPRQPRSVSTYHLLRSAATSRLRRILSVRRKDFHRC